MTNEQVLQIVNKLAELDFVQLETFVEISWERKGQGYVGQFTKIEEAQQVLKYIQDTVEFPKLMTELPDFMYHFFAIHVMQERYSEIVKWIREASVSITVE